MNAISKSIRFALLLPWWLWTGSTLASDTVDLNTQDCTTLYLLASRLEPGTRHYRSPLFNEKTDAVATAVGSAVTAGYYYFGFRITREYYQDYRAHRRLQTLDSVRRTMAQKHCFEKS